MPPAPHPPHDSRCSPAPSRSRTPPPPPRSRSRTPEGPGAGTDKCKGCLGVRSGPTRTSHSLPPPLWRRWYLEGLVEEAAPAALLQKLVEFIDAAARELAGQIEPGRVAEMQLDAAGRGAETRALGPGAPSRSSQFLGLHPLQPHRSRGVPQDSVPLSASLEARLGHPKETGYKRDSGGSCWRQGTSQAGQQASREQSVRICVCVCRGHTQQCSGDCAR